MDKTQTKNETEKDEGDKEEEEDPFNTRIENSGCSKYHYALQVLPYSSFSCCIRLFGSVSLFFLDSVGHVPSH